MLRVVRIRAADTEFGDYAEEAVIFEDDEVEFTATATPAKDWTWCLKRGFVEWKP